MSDEEMARAFHSTYERLAPAFGYETRAETKAFNPESPNGKLMVAVCREVRAALASAPASAPLPLTDDRIDEIADSLPAIPLSWERDREFARRIARAALSGGSPEPVSGSEGEEEGGKDVARLDWLESNRVVYVDHRHGGFKLRRNNDELSGWCHTLREAIDEAMAHD